MTRAAEGCVGGHVDVTAVRVAGDPMVVVRLKGQPRQNEIMLSLDDAQHLAEVLYGQAVAFFADRKETGAP